MSSSRFCVSPCAAGRSPAAPAGFAAGRTPRIKGPDAHEGLGGLRSCGRGVRQRVARKAAGWRLARVFSTFFSARAARRRRGGRRTRQSGRAAPTVAAAPPEPPFPGSRHLPCSRAMTSVDQIDGFTAGLLEPAQGPRPDSSRRAPSTKRVLRSMAETRDLVAGAPRRRVTAPRWMPSSTSSAPPQQRTGSAPTTSPSCAAYLANSGLAAGEGRVERFFVDVVLLRVLYARALVAAPRLALGCAFAAGAGARRPRGWHDGVFLSLSRGPPAAPPWATTWPPSAPPTRRTRRATARLRYRPGPRLQAPCRLGRRQSWAGPS